MDSKKEIYKQLINNRRWQVLRLKHIKANPLCARCLEMGLFNAAHEVHHRRPVEWGKTRAEMERLAYDPDNLMSVCVQCHKDIHNELRSMSQRYAGGKKERKRSFVQRVIKKFFEND